MACVTGYGLFLQQGRAHAYGQPLSWDDLSDDQQEVWNVKARALCQAQVRNRTPNPRRVQQLQQEVIQYRAEVAQLTRQLRISQQNLDVAQAELRRITQ